MKNILIVGNLGYIGPVLVKHLKHQLSAVSLIGVDNGLFEASTVTPYVGISERVDHQIYCDVRDLSDEIFDRIEAVVYLAAISNDPMGNEFASQTIEINAQCALRTAEMAKKNGVSRFVFASSCSIYGEASDYPRAEEDRVNPLTAYAKSKVMAEAFLKEIADENFVISCLRFATACGASPRFRLDLVLNDFVAGALLNKKIEILSDGTPKRPLIDVTDMARAFEWGCVREVESGGAFLIVNVGSDDWNFTVEALARSVKDVVGDVEVSINSQAEPDKRSYAVNFELFKKLAPGHIPIKRIEQTIEEVARCIEGSSWIDSNYRSSPFIRLNTLRKLIEFKQVNENLEWLS